MTQKHYAQNGTFHITTNVRGKVPWLMMEGVPEIIIDDLMMTKRLYGGKVFAFCILPDHMHIVMSPGEKGLSRFMNTFKGNSSRDVHRWLEKGYVTLRSGASGGSATEIMIIQKYTHARCADRLLYIHEPPLRGVVYIGWQKGFHDERIRDVDQRTNALRYVRGNAHHHHLVDDPNDWPWTSHNFASLLDPLEIWFH